MAYTVNTGLAPFCQSEDRPRSVPVARVGVSAVLAPEGSFGEPEPLRGSCEAARARHRGVGGRDVHHLSSRPHGTLDRGIHRLVKQINDRSSRTLRQEIHTWVQALASWTSSYFAATVGGATLEVVKRYVENQRNV